MSRLGKERKLQQLRAELGVAPEHNIGEVYVRRFTSVLEDMYERGLVRGWIVTSQYSPEDRRGIDIIVMRPDKKDVPFSVTSTTEEVKRHRKKNPQIPHVAMKKKFGMPISRSAVERIIVRGFEMWDESDSSLVADEVDQSWKVFSSMLDELKGSNQTDQDNG